MQGPPSPPSPDHRESARSSARTWVLALAAAFVVFGVFRLVAVDAVVGPVTGLLGDGDSTVHSRATGPSIDESAAPDAVRVPERARTQVDTARTGAAPSAGRPAIVDEPEASTTRNNATRKPRIPGEKDGVATSVSPSPGSSGSTPPLLDLPDPLPDPPPLPLDVPELPLPEAELPEAPEVPKLDLPALPEVPQPPQLPLPPVPSLP